MGYLGRRQLRLEDRELLTTGGTYAADVRHPLLDGAVHVNYLQSSVAHARITRFDTTASTEMEGVLAVFTGRDVDVALPGPFMPFYHPAFTRPLMATDRVRFVGEIVAIIVADDEYVAQDAADLVEIDYEPLPLVPDVDAALAGTELLFPEAGTNVAFNVTTLGVPADRDPQLFDDCEVTVSERLTHQRLATCPLEVRSGSCAWDSAGRLHIWVSCQQPHVLRTTIADTLDLATDDVHLVPGPQTGGGFGAKGGRYPEEILLGWIARRVRRPVRWTETRTQNMIAMAHARTDRHDITIGGDRDGTIRAIRIDCLKDAGAYPMTGAFLPWYGHMMAVGAYRIPRVEFRGQSVVTNHAPIHGFRGAGRAQVTAAVERMVDRFAVECGLDPADVRMHNFIQPEQFPYKTPGGAVYDSGNYPEALRRAKDLAGYDTLRQEQQRRRDNSELVQLGIGVSSYVVCTVGAPDGRESGRVWVDPDGTVGVATGSTSNGQGHATAWPMIVADLLGVPPEHIRFFGADSDYIPDGEGTIGSRSLQLGGVAVRAATQVVVDQARRVAARLLEAAVDDIIVDTATGRFHVAGISTAALRLDEIAAAATDEERASLNSYQEFVAEDSTYSFGTHICVVDVDTETGKVWLRRHIAVDDAGMIVNPLLFDGQVHGGIGMGLSAALLEEVLYDNDCNPRTTNFADYGIITIAELVQYETDALETPTPMNSLGVKGVAESGTIGATSAAWNAVLDALRTTGVKHLDMPMTPQRVWEAVASAVRAAPGPCS